ncbi:MAG TPA: hypothetical protein DIU35_08135 [Candidatus Latescibacteria bacterium]|nr:hypothetical protein [Gemmatimonadota bacterium]HCR17437.1 hypothetical protein [Candidatus Latescibacterota bacterium]
MKKARYVMQNGPKPNCLVGKATRLILLRKKEGTFSAFVEWDGAHHDMHPYSLLRSEWLE